MKCFCCGKPIHLQCSDDNPKKIDGQPVCKECYYEGLGKLIEKHPIGLFHYDNK